VSALIVTGRLRSLVFGWVSRGPVTGQSGVVKSHRKRLGSNRAAAIPIGVRLILPPCGLLLVGVSRGRRERQRGGRVMVRSKLHAVAAKSIARRHYAAGLDHHGARDQGT